MLVSEVKELRCEDGGSKEPQKEEAAGGQVLHVLPENQMTDPEAHIPAGETEAAKTSCPEEGEGVESECSS